MHEFGDETGAFLEIPYLAKLQCVRVSLISSFFTSCDMYGVHYRFLFSLSLCFGLGWSQVACVGFYLKCSYIPVSICRANFSQDENVFCLSCLNAFKCPCQSYQFVKIDEVITKQFLDYFAQLMEMNPAVIFRLRDNGKQWANHEHDRYIWRIFHNVERELNRVYIYLPEDGFIY